MFAKRYLEHCENEGCIGPLEKISDEPGAHAGPLQLGETVECQTCGTRYIQYYTYIKVPKRWKKQESERNE